MGCVWEPSPIAGAYPEKLEKMNSMRYEGENEYKASKVVRYALQHGLIERPEKCQFCGRSWIGEVIEGHHHAGYSFKHCLDLHWLCKTCHSKAHVKMGKRCRSKILDRNLWNPQEGKFVIQWIEQ